MSRRDDYNPHSQANEVRISENLGSRIPLDNKISDLSKMSGQMYPKYVEGMLANVNSTADDFYCTPTYETFATATSITDSDQNINLNHWSGGGVLDLEAETAAQNAYINIQGYCPHGAVPIPFGKQDDPNDWYNTQGIKRLDMRIKAGDSGASGNVQVVTQQFRRY